MWMGIFEEIDENEIWRLGEKGRQKGERGGGYVQFAEIGKNLALSTW